MGINGSELISMLICQASPSADREEVQRPQFADLSSHSRNHLQMQADSWELLAYI